MVRILPGGRTCRDRVNRRFTLVELLVVVVIIAILSSMLLPVLAQARRKAYIVACGGNQKQLYTASAIYSSDFDSRLPPVFASAGGYEGYGYGAWAVPTYLYPNNHINQPSTTVFVKDYVGGHVEDMGRGNTILRCPGKTTGMNAVGQSYAIGPDGKGYLYSTYAYYYMGFYTEKHLTFDAASKPFHSVYPHRFETMQAVADAYKRRFAVFGDNIGISNDNSYVTGSNHGTDEVGCEGGNLVFSDGSLEWFPFHYKGTDLLTNQASGWYLADKCWFVDQSQGRRWFPPDTVIMGSDFNGGACTTYVGYQAGNRISGKQYNPSTGELLGGPQPW